MDIVGRYKIQAPRARVWEGLNDPEILAKAIPGCQELSAAEDGEGFAATVKLKIGPVGATFKGSVSLENLNPPESYTLKGEGKGGVAGFGKGSADVSLEETEDKDGVAGGATILSYKANAQVGGKLAQIGSRLIKGTVARLAGEFFTSFAAALDAEAEEMPADDLLGGEAGA